MIIKDFDIDGLLLIEPDIFNDERGYFFESYNLEKFNKAVGHKINFVQDNHSFSSKHTLRGIHYQLPPFAQGKLVRVIEGHVFDVAVDLRASSKTVGKHHKIILSDTNCKSFFVPRGFAHGVLGLDKENIILYTCSNYRDKANEVSIIWNDKDLNIKWGIKKPILSAKDRKAQKINQFIKNFNEKKR